MSHLRFSLATLLIWTALAPASHAADATFTLGSVAGDMRPLISANTGPMPPTSAGLPDLSAYKDLGIGLIRTHDYYGPLDMPTLYPDFTKDPKQQSSYIFTSGVGKSADDKYSWSSDTVFSALQSAGFEPYFRIGDSYNNVKPPASDTERANWAAAAVEILRHYREGQWNGFQSSFQYVEIGNEPDNATFWPKPATKLDFFKLFAATAKALRSAFPTLKIGGPGLTQQACMSGDGKTWLSDFLDYVKTNSVPFDYLSWHIYSSNPADVASCAQYVRATLDGKGLTAVQSHLTEWNTDAENKSLAPGEAIALRANGRGAAVNTASWIRLQENKVDQVFFYRASDPAGGPMNFYGLIDGSYAYKKPGLAFKLWRTATSYSQRLTTAAAGSSDLTAMGASDGKGGYAFLVANSGKSSLSWTLTLPDGTTLDKLAVSLYTVSDALGATQISSTSGDVAIPAESAQLALLKPIGTGFNATASSSGSASSLTLAGKLKVAEADRGKSGKVYVGAQFGGRLYLLSNGSWQAWGGGALPIYFSGTLADSLDIPLLSSANASATAGAQVYLGYGLSESDMTANGKYKPIFTLPAK